MRRDNKNKLKKINQNKLIIELINANKLVFAKEQIEDYLEKYDDLEMKLIYGNVLCKLGYRDMAIDVYRDGVLLGDKYAVLSLLKLSLEYDDLLYSHFLIKQCKKYKYNPLDLKALRFAEMYVDSRLGLEIEPCSEKEFYTAKQIMAYSEEEALKHIKAHYHKEPIFNESVNVDVLFDKIKANIHNAKPAYAEIEKEMYYFNYPNVGFENGQVVDYLFVIVIKDTKQIFNFYPMSKEKIRPEHFINDIESEKQLVYVQNKIRLSQIDKFNQKYNAKK